MNHSREISRFQFILFIVTFVISAKSLALDPNREIHQYVHDKWSLKDGLPQSSVLGFVQTRDGYIWVATVEGLARFDGVHFEVFDTSNTPELKNNWIQNLFLDSQGGLWISTNGGGVTHLSNGKFRTYDANDGLSSDLVSVTLEDTEGRIWVGTRAAGLFRLENQRFQPVQAPTADDDYLAVFDLFQDSHQTLWVATNGGLYRLSGTDFGQSSVVQGLASPKVRAVFEDSNEQIWIGTNGGGLHRYLNGRAKRVNLKPLTMPKRVRSLFEDSDSNLWIATVGEGLIRLQDGNYTKFTSEQGLSDDTVSAFFEDRESNLWVGTYGGGINLFRNGKFTPYNTLSGLSHNIVFATCEDIRGDWWIATYRGGLNRYADGQFRVQSLESKKEPTRIGSLVCSPSGDVWVGTYGSGLYLIRDGRSTPFPNQELLSDALIPSLFEDKQGHLWIGTSNVGLYELAGETLVHYTTEQGLPSNMIRQIAQDHQGTMWFGTNNGLGRLRDGQFKSYTASDGLGADMIYSLLPDADGSLWIGTMGGGLARLHDDKIQTVKRNQGLFDDVIYTIAKDTNDNFWMTSNKGIAYTPKTEILDFLSGRATQVHSTDFGVEDGLKSPECNGGFQPASSQLSDGSLLFPTIEGLARINPNRIAVNPHRPPVLIERVLVDGRHTPMATQMEIPPDARRLELHYTAPSFVAPTQIKFKFMLENFDRDWIDAGGRRVAYYTNLGPGTYHFRVIAANSDGIWNEEGATVVFKKLPYFYQTAWFIAVVAVALLLLIQGGVRLRVHRIKQRNVELEDLVEERTEKLSQAHAQILKLEKETTERQMAGGFAHEIRNALTGANMVIKKILHWTPEGQSMGETNSQRLLTLFRTLKPKLDRESLKAIAPTVKAMNETEKQMDELMGRAQASVERSLAVTHQIFSYSEVGKERPGQDEVDVTEVLKEIRAEREDVFVEHGIHWDIGLEDPVLIRSDRQHVYTIFNNLILNASQSLITRDDRPDNPRRIDVKIHQDQDHHNITLEDTGAGISETDLQRIFDPFFSTNPTTGTGLGLGLVRKYVSMYGGSINFTSEPGKGTTATVILPKKQFEASH